MIGFSMFLWIDYTHGYMGMDGDFPILGCIRVAEPAEDLKITTLAFGTLEPLNSVGPYTNWPQGLDMDSCLIAIAIRQPHGSSWIHWMDMITGWWFGTFVIFPLSWEFHHPN